MSAQLTLEGLAVEQPRVTRDEAWPLYEAILRLRGGGHAVYRAGRDRHVVDGVTRSTSWVMRQARLYPWCQFKAFIRGGP